MVKIKELTALALAGITVWALCACGGTVTKENSEVKSKSEESVSSDSSKPVSVAGSPSPSASATPSEQPSVPVDPAEVLKDKVALFYGDSIVAASTHDTEHPRWGWAGRIQADNGMKYGFNYGVDGASVSNVRKTNTVIAQMKAHRALKADLVVLEGGVNDAWDSAKIGTVSEMSPEDMDVTKLDLSTLAGGMENVFYYARQYYSKATVVYVINFKLKSYQGSLADMSAYVDMTKKLCEKWDIPYLDLYNDEEFNKRFNVSSSTPDGIHPNSAGYDILAPVIAQFMAEAYAADHP